jgi:hypothetical protein
MHAYPAFLTNRFRFAILQLFARSIRLAWNDTPIWRHAVMPPYSSKETVDFVKM